MKWAYIIPTDISWSKFMFLVSWLYVILTLFEQTHINDTSMEKWGDEFKNLFACELTILLLLTLDIVVAVYHNFYDTVFKQSAFFNAETLISDDRTANGTEKTPQPVWKKRIHISANAPSIHSQKTPDEKASQKKTILEFSKETFSKQERPFLTNLKIFFLTFKEHLLLLKLILLVLFYADFIMYFKMYPVNTFRFSRFFRTILFPLFSKPTRRTLQAVFHSIKRIFDYFIFFFSIVFLYALLGYKIFYDDDRSYYIHPYYDSHVQDYNSYHIIVNSLMVLVTFDNYPLVMRPFFEMSAWCLIYFMPYIFCNILFFKPVPIAVVYDGFRVGINDRRKKEAN